MRFALSRHGDYALRAALHLACHRKEGLQKSLRIATSMAIPVNYLPQILGGMIRQGLVFSVAGPRGGYGLARPAEAISLLEVIEAAEGPVGNGTCPLRGRPCDADDSCALHTTWRGAQATLVACLAGETLATLADERGCTRDCTGASASQVAGGVRS